MKVHLLWAVAVAVALLLFGWAERRVGAAHERMAHLADSLAAKSAELDAVSRAKLAEAHADSARDRERLGEIRRRQDALNAANRRTAAITAQFRSLLADSLHAGFDSLQAAHAATEANLAAQRDSALALFARAAAQRDTLATLLEASRAQNQAVSALLVQARRRPFFDRAPVKAVLLVGAYALGVWTAK